MRRSSLLKPGKTPDKGLSSSSTTPSTVAKKKPKKSTSSSKRRLSTTINVPPTSASSPPKDKKSKRKRDDGDEFISIQHVKEKEKEASVVLAYTGNYEEDSLLNELYKEFYTDQSISVEATDRAEKTRAVIESKAAFYKDVLLSGKVSGTEKKPSSEDRLPASIQAKIDAILEASASTEAEQAEQEPQRKSKRTVSFKEKKVKEGKKKKDKIFLEVGRPWMLNIDVGQFTKHAIKCNEIYELDDRDLSSSGKLGVKMHLNAERNRTIMQSLRQDFYHQKQPVLLVEQSGEDVYRSQIEKKMLNSTQDVVSSGDLFRFLYEHESKTRTYPYMSRQNQVNSKMRSILVDWLGEVHYKFKLAPQTLWLTISILDRYLEKIVVTRAKLQLVGVTALYIACKYEEITAPDVGECVYITDNAYEVSEVLDMECKILEELNMCVFVPTAYTFLCRYLDVIKASKMVRNISYYYAERNLQEYDSLLMQPHMFAASALYAALVQRSQYSSDQEDWKCTWPQVLVLESGLTESEVIETARTIIGHIMEEPETASKRRLNAIRKKYTSERFMGAAHLSIPCI